LCSGAQGGGDESWYVGSTPCFRANAAYSLYGVFTTEDGTSSSTSRRASAPVSMCNKKTYINSFYTTGGATMLSSALGINDYTGMATETCTVSYVNGGNQDNNKDQKNDRDGKDDKNNQNNKMSSTMACDDNGNFEYSMFEGGDCDGSNYNSTEDTLDSYNEAMQGIECVQIWSYEAYVLKSNSYGSSYSKHNNNRHRQLGYGSAAETILALSSPCNNYYYPGSPSCPGPVNEPKAHMERSDKALSRFSWVCLVWGGFLFFLAYTVHLKKTRRSEKRDGLMLGAASGENNPSGKNNMFNTIRNKIVKKTPISKKPASPKTTSKKNTTGKDTTAKDTATKSTKDTSKKDTSAKKLSKSRSGKTPKMIKPPCMSKNVDGDDYYDTADEDDEDLPIFEQLSRTASNVSQGLANAASETISNISTKLSKARSKPKPSKGKVNLGDDDELSRGVMI
jgi:hypothetical protein